MSQIISEKTSARMSEVGECLLIFSERVLVLSSRFWDYWQG